MTRQSDVSVQNELNYYMISNSYILYVMYILLVFIIYWFVFKILYIAHIPEGVSPLPFQNIFLDTTLKVKLVGHN
jgi:hypothetical protein